MAISWKPGRPELWTLATTQFSILPRSWPQPKVVKPIKSVTAVPTAVVYTTAQHESAVSPASISSAARPTPKWGERPERYATVDLPWLRVQQPAKAQSVCTVQHAEGVRTNCDDHHPSRMSRWSRTIPCTHTSPTTTHGTTAPVATAEARGRVTARTAAACTASSLAAVAATAAADNPSAHSGPGEHARAVCSSASIHFSRVDCPQAAVCSGKASVESNSRLSKFHRASAGQSCKGSRGSGHCCPQTHRIQAVADKCHRRLGSAGGRSSLGCSSRSFSPDAGHLFEHSSGHPSEGWSRSKSPCHHPRQDGLPVLGVVTSCRPPPPTAPPPTQLPAQSQFPGFPSGVQVVPMSPQQTAAASASAEQLASIHVQQQQQLAQAQLEQQQQLLAMQASAQQRHAHHVIAATTQANLSGQPVAVPIESLVVEAGDRDILIPDSPSGRSRSRSPLFSSSASSRPSNLLPPTPPPPLRPAPQFTATHRETSFFIC